MDLYSDNNPKTTTKGLGFKDKQTALNTIKIIKNRNLVYQKQVIITMYHRAKYHPYRNKKMEDAMNIYKKWMDKHMINYNKENIKKKNQKGGNNGSKKINKQKNILNQSLEKCSNMPLTGYYRDGYCNTDIHDIGTHTVCSEMTSKFLEFTKNKGNNLTEANLNFPGLIPGDRWCLCANRWNEAQLNDVAPSIIPQATNIKTLKIIPFDKLIKYRKSVNRVN